MQRDAVQEQRPRCEHLVQFSTKTAAIVERAAEHLLPGILGGQMALLIAIPEHLPQITAALRSHGADLDRASEEGRFVTVDAHDLLSTFVASGNLDTERFAATAEQLIADLAQRGRPIRAYGEMVGLLWDQGHINHAMALEDKWNEIAGRFPLSILCSYFVDAPYASSGANPLHDVRAVHSNTLSADDLVPANSTTSDNPSAQTITFACDLASIAQARRCVDTFSLQETEFIDRARLVVSEIVTNAVIHAQTTFSMSLFHHGTTLNVMVRDASKQLPVPQPTTAESLSGRGLSMLTSLCVRWGVITTTDGKIVWAEVQATPTSRRSNDVLP